MKLSDGLEHLVPFTGALIAYCICLAFLTLAMKRLELSLVYSIWAGVGTGITAMIGILYFKEELTLLKTWHKLHPSKKPRTF